MYKIQITYDTGDSFHQENGLMENVEGIQWKSLTKAKKALKDIEKHYHFYMMLNKEWNAGQDDKDKVTKNAKRCKWYSGDEYPYYSLLVENDKGERVPIRSFWCGYFEHLVGAEVKTAKDDSMSFETGWRSY